MCSEWLLNVEDEAGGTKRVTDNFSFWKILCVAPFYILLLSTKHWRILSHSISPFDLGFDSFLMDVFPETGERMPNSRRSFTHPLQPLCPAGLPSPGPALHPRASKGEGRG